MEGTYYEGEYSVQSRHDNYNMHNDLTVTMVAIVATVTDYTTANLSDRQALGKPFGEADEAGLRLARGLELTAALLQ